MQNRSAIDWSRFLVRFRLLGFGFGAAQRPLWDTTPTLVAPVGVWPLVACFLPRSRLFWVPIGYKIGQNDLFQLPWTTWSARTCVYEPVSRSTFGCRNPCVPETLTVELFCYQKEVKSGPKMCFGKHVPDPFGLHEHMFHLAQNRYKLPLSRDLIKSVGHTAGFGPSAGRQIFWRQNPHAAKHRHRGNLGKGP